MRFTALAAAAVILSASSVLSAQTGTTASVPPAFSYQLINTPLSTVSGSTFGTITKSYQSTAFAGGVSATATSAGGSDPTVSATLNFVGGGANTGGQFLISSDVVYYFEVTGPGNSPVGVTFTSSGQSSTDNPNVGVNSSVLILQPTGTGGYTADTEVFACAGNTSQSQGACDGVLNGQPSYNVNEVLQVMPNELYEVLVDASIDLTPAGNQEITASAMVDPTFSLAPGVSSAYSLTESPNLQAAAVTPEPSSFALLGTGLLGVAGIVKRRFA